MHTDREEVFMQMWAIWIKILREKKSPTKIQLNKSNQFLLLALLYKCQHAAVSSNTLRELEVLNLWFKSVFDSYQFYNYPQIWQKCRNDLKQNCSWMFVVWLSQVPSVMCFTCWRPDWGQNKSGKASPLSCEYKRSGWWQTVSEERLRIQTHLTYLVKVQVPALTCSSHSFDCVKTCAPILKSKCACIKLAWNKQLDGAEVLEIVDLLCWGGESRSSPMWWSVNTLLHLCHSARSTDSAASDGQHRVSGMTEWTYSALVHLHLFRSVVIAQA